VEHWRKHKENTEDKEKEEKQRKKKGNIYLESKCENRLKEAFESTMDKDEKKNNKKRKKDNDKEQDEDFKNSQPTSIFKFDPDTKQWKEEVPLHPPPSPKRKHSTSPSDGSGKIPPLLLDNRAKTDKEGNETENKSKSWAKITIRALTTEDADRQKWTSKKNEYPILPTHGIEEVVIRDKNDTLQTLLKFWTERDPDTKKEVEEFALRQCGPDKFEEILETCLMIADDPISTAMRAAEICDERKTRKNSSGVDWKKNKEKAIDWATKLAEKIPNQLSKLHMTRYYSEAGKLVIDENLDLAIENKYFEICKDPVFMERLNYRWMLPEDKSNDINLPNLSPMDKIMRKKVSPCCWFSMQGIFYLIFVGMLSYSLASSDTAVYSLAFENQLTDLYFDDTYNGISTYDDFWNWMQTTVLTNTFPEANTSRLNPKLFLSTPEITLRQYRVAPFTEGCNLKFNLSCYPSIDRAAIENTILGLDGNNQTWKNTEWADNDHMGIALHGLHFLYPPGGYMALVSGDQITANDTLSLLQQSQWLDVGTRAVIVEFAMYSISGNLFAIFEVLVEFTHINVVSQNQEITVVDNQPFDPRRGDWVILAMFLFVLGYILQEGCELLATSINIYKDLKKEKKRQAAWIHHKRYESFFHNWKRALGHIKSLLPLWGKAWVATMVEHFCDFWNIMDAVTNTALFVYVVIFCLVSIPGSDKRVPDPTDVSLSVLWEMRFLIEISKIFGAVGVILAYFRLLYYFIPIKAIGPLVIIMLWMYLNVGYFIALLAFMILGFSAAFNLIYGGIVTEFTGFGIAIFQCINIAYNQQFFITNDEFVQLPIHWAGDILMVIYLVLSAILLVNLLIAMMSTTYNELMQEDKPIEGQWSVAHGDLLLHYERFPFFPPPFLFIQAIIFVVASFFSCCCCRDWEFSWILVGHWTSEDRLVDRLFEEKKLENPDDPGLLVEEKKRKDKIGEDIEKKRKIFGITLSHL